MKLYIIRHGETEWNKLKRLQGRTNIRLSDKGIELAKKTAIGMKDINIDLAITSPLDRAYDTAKYVIGDRDIPIIKDDRLMEISFGDWEGELSVGGNTIVEEKMNTFFKNPMHFDKAPGGESIRDVCIRTKNFYDEIVSKQEYEDKSILISTHGCAGRCLLCNFFETEGYTERNDMDIWRGCVPKNCSVTIVNVKNGKGTIEELDHIYYSNIPDDIMPVHKRRERYKGKYPKKYSEKYKELQPEKYADTIEKVKSKGSTPAGMHISIMVDEILDFLDIKPGQHGLDATLGYGGHTKAMLEKLDGHGTIYALDIDPIESAKTKERLRNQGFGEDILKIRNINFADIDKVSEEAGKFDFVLADLGVSSMQIDNPERGFTFKSDGPLDLRLNPNEGESAAERLKSITREEFEGMLIENSDEPYAAEIAREVMGRIKSGRGVETTWELKDAIEKVLEKVYKQEKIYSDRDKKELLKKTCQRTFQALRIDVNSEFEVLYSFLDKLPGILNPGGRAAILTFHSGEDRLVKKSFKKFYKEGIYSEIADNVIRPSAKECAMNGRARSTKMRWAVK